MAATGRIGVRGPVVRLIGDFALTCPACGPVELAGGSQRLVALAAVNGGPLSRPALASALWPEATAVRAKANLRAALSRVTARCPESVAVTASRISLTPTASVDLVDAIRDAGDYLSAELAAEHVVLPDPLSDRVDADVLPDWPDHPWLRQHRRRWRQLRLQCLELSAERLRASGRHGAALDAAHRVLDADWHRESTHRLLIAIHLDQGNRATAAACARDYRALLRDDLGLEPPAWLGEVLGSAHTGRTIERHERAVP